LAYRRIAPEISSYMGSVFEDICKQYLWKLLLERRCEVDFSDLGRWWGTNPKTKTQEEIDIMGTDKDAALFGEFTSLRKTDLPRAVSTKQLRWAMSRS